MVLWCPGSFLKATVILKGQQIPDFPGNDNQTEGDNDKGSGMVPDGVPAEGEDDEDGDDDEGFETVEDEEEDTDSKVVTKTPMRGSGQTGGLRRYGSRPVVRFR